MLGGYSSLEILSFLKKDLTRGQIKKRSFPEYIGRAFTPEPF